MATTIIGPEYTNQFGQKTSTYYIKSILIETNPETSQASAVFVYAPFYVIAGKLVLADRGQISRTVPDYYAMAKSQPKILQAGALIIDIGAVIMQDYLTEKRLAEEKAQVSNAP